MKPDSMDQQEYERSSREDGIYWVRDRRTDRWTIARWNGAQSWWVLAWIAIDDPAAPSGCTGDPRFSEVGPRILEPEKR